MEDQPASAKPASNEPFLVRHDFLLRRLHSLSGLIPVGAYMVVHLATNASVLNGAATFQNQVDNIHSLGKALLPIEITFIFLPLLFHALFGFVIIASGKSNSSNYPLPRNIRYTMQQWTGVIAFLFIMYHVLSLHWLGKPLGGGNFNHEYATSSAHTAIAANIISQIGYAVGVLACVFHLANGLSTMGMTWGVWTSPAAQRRADYVCGAFGVLLAVIGLSALLGISQVDPVDAQAMEKARVMEREEQQERVQKLKQGIQSAE